MRIFKDTKGREWEINFNIRAAKKLNERLKEFDLDFLDADQIFIKIADVFFCANFLWLVCRDQAETRGITDEEFGESLGGITLFNARAAFLDEYIDFFPDPAVQGHLREILDRSDKLAAAGREAITRILEARQTEVLSELNSGALFASSPGGAE